MRRTPRLLDPRITGSVLAVAVYPLLVTRPLWVSALALECLALAFWLWARAAADAREQLPRWGWLRRPAQALWLAVAVGALGGHLSPAVAGALRLVEAGALVWAGLELLAAVPAARPYTDLTGPLLAIRPWLPVLLPAAGFLVLWRHAGTWTALPAVRGVAEVLLVLTALLGTLRAFGRLQWTASLRWLTVADGALAALLVALGTLHATVSLMLWAASSGGRTLMLAGELRGATPRRGALLHRLWRAAAWTASAALSWPLMLGLLAGQAPGPRPLMALAAALPVTLAAWITVRRFVEAPERRLVQRPDPALTMSHIAAAGTLALGPLALLAAWWTGFEATWPSAAIALLPALAGGALGLTGSTTPAIGPLVAVVERAGGGTRGVARESYRLVVTIERRLWRALVGLLRAVAAPLRDLHAGDPQEVLLLVAAVAVLAMLFPFLR